MIGCASLRRHARAVPARKHDVRRSGFRTYITQDPYTMIVYSAIWLALNLACCKLN